MIGFVKKILISKMLFIFIFLCLFISLLGGGSSESKSNDSGYYGSTGITEKEDTYYPLGSEMNNYIWGLVFQNGNPFPQYPSGYDGRQCTAFAWYRFYQEYKFDSGARGNGKDNAREIVFAHPDKFVLSNTPAPASIFSAKRLYPEDTCGHVGFVEKYDGSSIWISHGNVNHHGIFFNQKFSYLEFENHYCKGGCEFAVRKN